MDSRVLRGISFAALIFLLVQVGAISLVEPFKSAGYQAVEDPTDPTNSAVYMGAILVATAFMLAAFKYDFDRAVRAVVILSSALVSWYVFSVVVPSVTVSTPAGAMNVLAIGLSLAVAAALLVYPEWYVIDAAGVVMGAGAAGLFGISFGLLPALLLLSALAIYDAISVYGTRHMLSLAEGVMDLRIPVILVIPLTLSYSLLEDDFSGASGVHESDEGDEENETEGEPDEETAEESVTERDAFFIGLGDAVMPSVMIASAAFFSPAAPLGIGWLPALNLPALLSMAGTFVGLGILLWAVMKGRAHAGLPLLNGGAIVGYLVGSLAAGVSLVQALGLAAYV